jgi:hypothetical protein
MLRTVTALLLVWVAFDLAAIDTCALGLDRGQASAQTSVGAPDARAAFGHHHAVFHPDHCFCHGLSTGAGTRAALIAPLSVGGAVPDVPSGHLLRASTALYHPPQRSA